MDGESMGDYLAEKLMDSATPEEHARAFGYPLPTVSLNALGGFNYPGPNAIDPLADSEPPDTQRRRELLDVPDMPPSVEALIADAFPEGVDPDPKTNPAVRGQMLEVEVDWDADHQQPVVQCLTEADPFHDPDASPTLTDAEADTLIDRLASFDERQRRIRAQAEAMCKDIDRQRQGVLYKHETALREWTARKLRGKSRSVKRLVGSIGFRTVPGRMTVHALDYDRALAWAKANLPEAVKETVDLKAVKPVEDYHPDTGEVGLRPPAPCFQWQPERESFFVKGSRTAAEGEADDD